MQIILPSLVLIGVYIGHLILKSFWPKYFEAKGTNQATKEDIGEITKIVESIKSDLLKDVEDLKGQISLVNQHKLNLKASERGAILEYSSKLNAYIYFLVGLDLTIYNEENYTELLKERIEINKKSYEFSVAEANLGLFINDDEFIKMNMKLKLSISEYETKLRETMQEITHQYKMCEIEISGKPEKSYDIKMKYYKEIPAKHVQHHKEAAKIFTEIAYQNAVLRNFLRNKKDHLKVQ